MLLVQVGLFFFCLLLAFSPSLFFPPLTAYPYVFACIFRLLVKMEQWWRKCKGKEMLSAAFMNMNMNQKTFHYTTTTSLDCWHKPG